MSESIKLDNGKYEFYTPQNKHSVYCKRHGNEWRDFIGDNAVFHLYHYTLALQNELARRMNSLEYDETIERLKNE